MTSRRAIVGVDVGGTFTDLAWFDAATGAFRTEKASSNRGDEAVGFMEGLRRFGPVASLGAIVHGTTVGTNALLERKGARVGLITTKGFRDVLEMRRRDRPNTWGLWGDFIPVIERDMRLEVAERTLADGAIREAVDPDEVKTACAELLAKGAEAVAIVFINAYANPENERLAAEAARAVWPNGHVAHSAEILPEIREFERTSTTALNGYLQPVVASYLGKLQDALAADSYAGSFHIVQSNGGVMSTDAARRFPVRTALSGPAAGVIAARAIGLAAGYPDIVTADLGGTSFDVSLVAGGEAALAAQTTIDFGLVVRTPMIEITTIGAGGGSIAHVDAGGLLAVGPESAGSRPGPVCYGQGNDRPTLTDANLVLGRINAARPIGGKLASLDREAAAAALLAHVGRPLGLSAEDAAEAVVRVANAKMAGAIRLVSIERGHDPTRFTALPFGGGGALHVGALIREVGLKAALVPRYPGVTSALGCIIADIRHDQVLTLNLTLDGLDAAALSARLAREGEAARGIVAAAGLDMEEIEVRFALDMHYVGQTHTVTALLPPPCGEGGEHGEPGGVRATLAAEASATPSRPSAALRATLPARGREDILTSCATEAIVRAAFEKAYSAAFSRLLPGVPARIVNLRTTAIGRRPAFDLKALAPGLEASLDAARDGTRPVWFDGGWREATIWRRLLLPVGAVIAGPAILEQGDATTVIDPGLVARVDAFGNLIVERV